MKTDEIPQFGGACLCGHSEEEHGAGGECEAIGCDCVEFNGEAGK